MKKKMLAIGLPLLIAAICVIAVTAMSSTAFDDVDKDAWYADGVQYVVEHRIMNGVSKTQFDPEGEMTRGMFVTILYRMDGAKAVSKPLTFTDVSTGSYYEVPVCWAASAGIITGYSETEFAPDAAITREQFAAMLYRYSEKKGYHIASESNLSIFHDAVQISDYAKDAMRWANEVGLLTGTSADTLSPSDTATRAQAATIIMRYEKLYSDEKTENDQKQRKENSAIHSYPAVKEDDSPRLVIKSVSAKQGEKVQVCAEIVNNPGIVGMTLSVSYDDTALRLVKAENGEALQDVLTFTPAKELRNGSSFVWYATNVNDEQIKDGSVLILTFEVSETAEGSIPVALSGNDDIFDADLNPLSVPIEIGYIELP